MHGQALRMSAGRKFEYQYAGRGSEKQSYVRKFENKSALKKFENWSAVRKFESQSAVRKFENHSAVRYSVGPYCLSLYLIFSFSFPLKLSICQSAYFLNLLSFSFHVSFDSSSVPQSPH